MTSEARSKQYHSFHYILYFITLCLDAGVLAFFFFSGLSLSLQHYVSQMTSSFVLQNTLYVFMLSTVIAVLHLPLNFLSGYYWEHKFKLSNQKLIPWVVDEVKKFALSLGMLIVVINMTYVLLRQFPQNWWMGAAACWIFLSVVLAKIFPTLIVPLFYKYEPVNKKSLRDKVFETFEKCGVQLKEIYAIDLSKKTSKANAFICGLGKGRRVVLSDTLLEKFDDDEVEVVVAHELGHYKHRDMLKLLAVNGLAYFIGLFFVHQFLQFVMVTSGISSIADISLLPIFALTLMAFGFISAPLLNAFSRMVERQADAFSLAVTGKPGAFLSLMEKLGEMNIAETHPSKLKKLFFFDHPPIDERIAFAKGFQDDSKA